MQAPSRNDYVKTYFTLYERFEQGQNKGSHRGHPYKYVPKCLILFFTIMMIRRITAYKAQHRWLKHHEEEMRSLGFEQVPDRTTLSRRNKQLYPMMQAFIAYLDQWAESLGPEFDSQVLIEDASLDESRVVDQKKVAPFAYHPEAVVGDNAYFKAMRVRQWAAQGVVLDSPAAIWKNGRYAQAYHHFLE